MGAGNATFVMYIEKSGDAWIVSSEQTWDDYNCCVFIAPQDRALQTPLSSSLPCKRKRRRISIMHFFNVLALAAAATAATVSTGHSGQGGWSILSPIPFAPRQEHSVVALSDTEIAIVGGILPNPDTGVGFNTTSIVQLYDTLSDSWTTLTSAPIQVNHPNVAVVDGEIYLLGGLAVAPDGAWRAFSDSWKYNRERDEWSELEPLPVGRETGSAAVGVVGRTIFLAGGMRTLEPIGVEGEQDTVDYVSAFDTDSSTWIQLPDGASVLPEGRDHAAAAVIDGKRFYVLGGRLRGQYNVKDTVFVLDTEHLEAGWVTQSSRMPTPRGGVAGATIGKKVYIFGGEGNPIEGSEGVFDNVEVYDAEHDTWQQLEPMRLPRHGGAAASIGDRVYLPGGGIREGGSPVDVNDVFALS